MSDLLKAHSPELLQRAHELLGAPHLFGMEIGFNLPAFIIALVITTILVIGINESARFNATIVVIKVAVVLFVIALGVRYINSANWGHDWGSFAPTGLSGIGAGAAYIFFAYIGFDAVSTTAQEAKNPQRDLPIGIIASLLVCTVLIHRRRGRLTGMVQWQQINIEAPDRPSISGSRSVDCVTHHYDRRACRINQRHAGNASRPDPRPVLDGKRWAAAQKILRRRPSEVPHSLEEHDSCRTCWRRLLAA